MGIVAWIIFGALAGWAAGKLAGGKLQTGWLANIVVGVAGAFVGGVLYKFLTDEEWNFRFNPSSFVVAVLGSIALLTALRLIRESS